MPETVIDVRHLTKRFGGRAVVADVSMTVNRGEIVGFLGPNGSGKTTTIRMMCGLLTLDEGEGEVLGHDLRTEARAIKDRVGQAVEAGDEVEVLLDGQVLVEREALRHVAEARPDLAAAGPEVEAEHPPLAAVEPEEPADHPDRRRLS